MKNNENNYQEGDSELLNGFVNAKKAMQLLSCKTTTLYHLRKNKLISYSKINAKIFYEIESIKALIQKNRVNAE